MTGPASLGLVYRCGVCGAEISILVSRHGVFAPRCCNTDMIAQSRRVTFYVCPRCGAEVGLIGSGRTGAPAKNFQPRCCAMDMKPKAA